MLPSTVQIANEVDQYSNVFPSKEREEDRTLNFEGKSRLDFFINEDRNWGIEFLIENSKPMQHLYDVLFGKYSKGNYREHVVVNFLQKKNIPKRATKDIPINQQINVEALPKGIWHVIINDEKDFITTAQIIPWDNKKSGEHKLPFTDNKNVKREFTVYGDYDHPIDIVFEGDFLTDSMFNPIQLTLQLIYVDPKLGLQIKESSLGNVPLVLDPFVKAVKEALGIEKNKTSNYFLWIMEKKLNSQLITKSKDLITKNLLKSALSMKKQNDLFVPVYSF